MTGMDKYKHSHVTLLIIITSISSITRTTCTKGLSYWTVRLNNQAEQRKSFLVKDVYDSYKLNVTASLYP